MGMWSVLQCGNFNLKAMIDVFSIGAPKKCFFVAISLQQQPLWREKTKSNKTFGHKHTGVFVHRQSRMLSEKHSFPPSK